MDAIDDVAFLAGSEQRAAVVDALQRGGPLAKDEIVERCDAARVTVNRNLEQLADRGFVAETGDGWRLTLLGAFVAGSFLELVDTVETADELAPVLRRLPPGAFDLAHEALAGARVTESTAANPYAPAERHAETLQSASEVILLLPAVSPQNMRATMAPLERGALSLDLVVAPSVAETFRTDVRDLIEDILATGQATIHETPEPVPFFLGLIDGTVQIGVSDDEGIPRALAESDDERVRSWAEATIESRRAAAEPFDLDAEATDTP